MKIHASAKLRSTVEACWSQLILPALVASASLVFLTTFFPAATHSWTFNPHQPELRCAPDGSIHSNLWDVEETWPEMQTTPYPPALYNPHWDSSLFISITLGFGSFAFSTAKVIDVFWDLIIGRGGQILIVLLVYPTIRMTVVLFMEDVPVDFPLFTRIWFDRISLTTMSAVCRTLLSTSNETKSTGIEVRFPRMLRLAAIFLCCAYVLVFPTIVSAMTGYQAKLSPYIPVPPLQSGVIVDASQITFPAYVFLDGHRVGLPDRIPTANLEKHDEDTLLTYRRCMDKMILEIDSSNHSLPKFMQYLDNETQCRGPNVFLGPAYWFTHTSGWHSIDFNSSIFINGNNYTLGRSSLHVLWQPVMRHAKFYSLPETNHTFTKDWILANSFCRPANTYQWGFSCLLLLVFCVMSTLFSMIVFLLRYNLYWNSRAGRLKPRISVYRDAIDLAAELKRQFGEQIVELSDSELEQRVQRCQPAIGIELDELPSSRRAEAMKTRRAWEIAVIQQSDIQPAKL